MLLSSQETHSKFCTKEALEAIKELYENHKDYREVPQFYKEFLKEEDPRVREAIEKGTCTKDAFPKCEYECGCDENIYCPDCCIQQKAFRCYTCDKVEIKLYCETCWKRDHQGHDCEEFFYPVRCATVHK